MLPSRATFTSGKPGCSVQAGRDFADRFAGDFGQRLPEIRGRGVRIFVRRDVFADAVAENIVAEKTLEHANDRLPFAVGDFVEGAVRFRLGRDRLLHRMRGRARVGLHRRILRRTDPPGRIARDIAAQPFIPLGIEMIGALRAHPGGEAFVQPEIVPPRHRDEIAKPLVRHLVRDDREDVLLRVSRGSFRIEKQDALVVGDAAPVLHRAAETAGERDQVELRQRIGHAEVIVVVMENLRRALERVAAHLGFPFGGRRRAV